MKLSAASSEELLSILRNRFEKNMSRHKGIKWADVHSKLTGNAQVLWSLNEMERTGGEPDITGYDGKTGEFIFTDCSPESPSGRRNLCYDRKAMESRKEFRPENNAIDTASAMGIEILDEQQYRDLQKLGNFDTRTSSWLKTPPEIRNLGGAVFGDRRYNQVFIYHNGAHSYYGSRGFRGMIKVL